MTLSSADQGIVSNLRREYGEAISKYSDEIVSQAWREFSQSEDYYNRNDLTLFPQWCGDLA